MKITHLLQISDDSCQLSQYKLVVMYMYYIALEVQVFVCHVSLHYFLQWSIQFVLWMIPLVLTMAILRSWIKMENGGGCAMTTGIEIKPMLSVGSSGTNNYGTTQVVLVILVVQLTKVGLVKYSSSFCS